MCAISIMASGTTNATTTCGNREVIMAFNPSARTNNAWDLYKKEKRPNPYEDAWRERLQGQYDAISSAQPYNFDPATDPLYQQYREQYTAGAQQAMAQGNALASGMTGGYGSTSIGAVGQQTNLNYMDRMNDALPQIEQNAYARYQGNQANDMSLYGITRDNASMDYQKYRDSMSDYQNNRATNYGEYSDSRNFDYGSFKDDRAYKDAVAAKAAGGGGRDRTSGVYISQMQVGTAYYAYQNGGEAALEKYLNELEAAHVPAEAIADLYESTIEDTTPIDWSRRGGRGAGSEGGGR
jgi:hypothetical protein